MPHRASFSIVQCCRALSFRSVPHPVPYSFLLVQSQYAQDDQQQPEYVPQRRTHSTSSVQNEADAYLAGLSGIKVDIDTNPYLKKQRHKDAAASAEVAKNVLKLAPPPQQTSPQLPVGPTMTYAEKLREAREAKASASADAPPSTAAAVAAAASPPAVTSAPEAPQAPAAVPTLSYSEKLKQAREATGTQSAAAVSSSPPAPPVASDPVVTPAIPPARASQQLTENVVLGNEDATRTKVRCC